MVCGLPSTTVIYGVRIALYCDLWCAECPLLLSMVCGLPSTVISGVQIALYCDLWCADGVWIALYCYLWCADCPLL